MPSEMELPYPNLRSKKSKTHLLKGNRLNGECFGKAMYAHVTEMTIDSCNFDDGSLDILRYYPSLTFLKIRRSGSIDTLEAIANCPQLKELEIESTLINSFHGIEFCQDLKSLILYTCGPANLDALNGMNLVRLTILNRRVRGEENHPVLDHLPEHLPYLKNLTCHYHDIIERIPSYPRLRSLSLEGRSIKEIGHLPRLVNIRIDGTSISDLEFLRGSPIVTVSCNNNNLTTIDALEGFAIKTLSCNDNKLTTLPSMPYLTSLFCSRNKIFTLQGLIESSELTDLNCSHNSLLNLRGLEGMKRLKTLCASNNDIFDISAIKDFPSFDYLDLSNNMIMHLFDYKFFNTRKQYSYYNFDRNHIEDITHLSKNTNVTVDLSNNPLNSKSRQMIRHPNSQGFVAYPLYRG